MQQDSTLYSLNPFLPTSNNFIHHLREPSLVFRGVTAVGSRSITLPKIKIQKQMHLSLTIF